MNDKPAIPKLPMLRIVSSALAVPIVIGVVWLAFYLANSVGVPIETVQAKVVGKQVVAAGTTYRANIVAGRHYIQSDTPGDVCLVELDVKGERVSGFVSEQFYQDVAEGEMIDVRLRMTRITGRMEVIEIVERTLTKDNGT